MDEDTEVQTIHRLPSVVSIILIILSVFATTSTDVLYQIWIDTFSNYTETGTLNYSSCKVTREYGEIDPYFILFVSDFAITVILGLLLLMIRCPCYKLITKHETRFHKARFALIGASDTVAALCFIYASRGCRTPQYLQAILLHLVIPVVFILRYIALRKRPTCRKLLCALLVLFAEFTLLIPILFPSLKDESIFPDTEHLYGHPNPLWALCFSFGIVPMAVSLIYTEKTVQKVFPSTNCPRYMNMLYFLFWTYLFSLLFLLFLFWTDCIPGFGMYDTIPHYIKEIWFNMKCFIGYEGCIGDINIVSGLYLFLVLASRRANVNILRYMEGANFLTLISCVSIPLLYMFLTLFDKDPLRWKPHAYISTWLSVAALCIMVPAIYIYHIGAPEIKPPPELQVYSVDHEVQTAEHNRRNSSRNSYVQYQDTDDADDTCRLLVYTDSPEYHVNYTAFEERELATNLMSVSTQSGADNSAGGANELGATDVANNVRIQSEEDISVSQENQCHDNDDQHQSPAENDASGEVNLISFDDDDEVQRPAQCGFDPMLFHQPILADGLSQSSQPPPYTERALSANQTALSPLAPKVSFSETDSQDANSRSCLLETVLYTTGSQTGTTLNVNDGSINQPFNDTDTTVNEESDASFSPGADVPLSSSMSHHLANIPVIVCSLSTKNGLADDLEN